MLTYDELLQEALTIKNNRRQASNTATLVGGHLVHIVEFLENVGKYWANLPVSSLPSEETGPTFASVKIGDGTIAWDAKNKCLRFNKGIVSDNFISAFGLSSDGGSGASFDLLTNWANYDESTANSMALGANLGYEIYQQLKNGVTDTYTKTQIDTKLGSLYIGTTKVQSASANQALTGITSVDSFVNFDTANSKVGVSGNIVASGWVSAFGESNSSLQNYGLGDLNNVLLSNPQNGQALVYDGAKWVNKAVSSGIGNANFSAVTTGSGNAITAATYANGVLSLTKGGTFALKSELPTKASWNYDDIYFRLTAGTEIPSGSDLNEYRTAGTYNVKSSTISNTIINTPNKSYGYKLVVNYTITGNYLTQTAYLSSSRGVYYRKYHNGTWTDWYFNITSNNIGEQSVSSAAKLSTPRSIWGNSFDGSRNIDGDLILPNDVSIQTKDKDGTPRTALYLSGGNNLFIGYGTSVAGYNTYIEGTEIIFRYNNGSGSHTEVMRLKDGMLGIGVTSPSQKFHVNGNILATGGLTANGYVSAFGASTTPTQNIGIGDLSNVTLTNPQANQALVYDGTKWVNKAVSSGSGSANIQVTTLGTGNAITAATYANGVLSFTKGSTFALKTKLPTKLWGNDFTGNGEINGEIRFEKGNTNRNVLLRNNGIRFVNTSSGNCAISLSCLKNDESESLETIIGSYSGWSDGVEVYHYTYFGGSYSSPYMVLRDAKLGVGVKSPREKVDVSGNVKATKFIGAFEGNADTATAVLDYGDPTKTIKIGYQSNSLTSCEYLAAYKEDNGKVFIKDIKPENVYGVGSAIALKNPRALWGQSFDGSGDVSGDMTDVGSISASGNFTLKKSGTSVPQLNVGNDSGTIGLYVATNGTRGLRDTGNSKFVIATDGTNVWIPSQNFGIGVTSPTEKLHINGNILATGGITANGYVSAFGQSSTTMDVELNSVGIGTAPSTSYKLYVSGATRLGGTTYLYGAVNIGSTSTTRAVTLNGTLTQATTTTSPTTSSTSAAVSLAGGMYIAKNLRVAGSVYYGSTPSTLSDMRYKDVIENRSIGLDKMADAPLFAFRYKDGGLAKIGTSAQYWQGVMGEFVEGEDILSLDYSALGVAMGISLAKHVKSSDERIAELESKVKDLENELKKYVA